jgi:hypothetical protein
MHHGDQIEDYMLGTRNLSFEYAPKSLTSSCSRQGSKL